MGDVRNGRRQRFDRTRRARDAKAVRLLLLEDVRHLAQLAGYGLVGRRPLLVAIVDPWGLSSPALSASP